MSWMMEIRKSGVRELACVLAGERVSTYRWVCVPVVLEGLPR